MAITKTNGIWCPLAVNAMTGNYSTNDIGLAGSGHKCAVIYQASRAGDIDGVYFATKSVTNDSFTLTGSMFTIDRTGSKFEPGSIISGASGTDTFTNADNQVRKTTDFSTPQTVAKGDWVCLHLEITTYSAGTCNIVAHTEHLFGARPNIGRCFEDLGAGSWSESTGNRAIAMYPKYTDDTTDPGIFGPMAWGMFSSVEENFTFNNASATTRYGVRCRFDTQYQLGGMFAFQETNTGDFDIKVYSDAGTLLATLGSYEGEYGNQSQFIKMFTFDTVWEPDVDTWYRVVIEPTSTTNCDFSGNDLGTTTAAGEMLSMLNCNTANKWHATAYTSSAWVDYDNATDHYVSPIIDFFATGFHAAA